MREVTDPYKGMKYSDIIAGLVGDARKAYIDVIPPLLDVPGTGRASWDASIGKYVV